MKYDSEKYLPQAILAQFLTKAKSMAFEIALLIAMMVTMTAAAHMCWELTLCQTLLQEPYCLGEP